MADDQSVTGTMPKKTVDKNLDLEADTSVLPSIQQMSETQVSIAAELPQANTAEEISQWQMVPNPSAVDEGKNAQMEEGRINPLEEKLNQSDETRPIQGDQNFGRGFGDDSIESVSDDDVPINSLPNGHTLSESEMDVSAFETQTFTRLDKSVFDAEYSCLLDDKYTGPIPHMVKNDIVYQNSKKENETACLVGVSSMAIEKGRLPKYKECYQFTSAQELNLLRKIDEALRYSWVESGRKIFVPGDHVDVADSGTWWPGVVSKVLVDTCGLAFYLINFTRGVSDDNFFVMYRVRAHENPLPVHDSIGRNSEAMKMHRAFLKATKQVTKHCCAGEVCSIEVVGGIREVVIELVDEFNHSLIVFDPKSEKVLTIAIWSVYKFRGICCRPEANPTFVKPSTVNPIFLPTNSGLENEEVGEGRRPEVDQEALVDSVVKQITQSEKPKKGKLKQGNSGNSEGDETTQIGNDNLVSIATVCVQQIMGDLQNIIDNQGGSIANVLGNLLKENQTLSSKLARHKYLTDANVDKFVDTIRGSSQELVRIRCLLGTDENDELNYFPKRLEKLEEKVKGIDEKLDLLLQRSNKDNSAATQGQEQNWPVLISPRRERDAVVSTSKDGPSNQESGQGSGSITESLVEKYKLLMPAAKRKDLPADSSLRDQCNSILSSSHKVPSEIDDVGKGGAIFRKVLSRNNISGREVTVVLEQVVQGTDSTSKQHNLCSYGSVERNSKGGSILKGIKLDELPESLSTSIDKMISSKKSALMDDRAEFVKGIVNSLQELFSDIQLLGENLPIKFSTTPRHVFDRKAPGGPLEDMINRNCEPIRSVLKFILVRIGHLSKPVLLSVFWEALRVFQKRYNNAILRANRKNGNGSEEKSDGMSRVVMGPPAENSPESVTNPSRKRRKVDEKEEKMEEEKEGEKEQDDTTIEESTKQNEALKEEEKKRKAEKVERKRKRKAEKQERKQAEELEAANKRQEVEEPNRVQELATSSSGKTAMLLMARKKLQDLGIINSKTPDSVILQMLEKV